MPCGKESDVAAKLIARNHVIPVMQVFDLVRRDEEQGSKRDRCNSLF